MSQNPTTDLLRYLLIERRLRLEPTPTLESLKDSLEAELKDVCLVALTKLSIKGDLKRMRKLFYTPVQFNFSENSYLLTQPTYTLLNLPVAIIDNLILSLKLRFALGEKSIGFENIKFEPAHTYVHEEYIPTMAKAIADGKEIIIKHKTINSKRSWAYQVCPYLLKVVSGKWVLYAEIDGLVKAYLLEEIVSLPEITDKKAVIPPIKEIEKRIATINTSANQ